MPKRKRLFLQTAKILQSAGFKTNTIVREGDAKTSIPEYADEWRPELIMVGSHGRKGLDRFCWEASPMPLLAMLTARYRLCGLAPINSNPPQHLQPAFRYHSDVTIES